MNIFEAVKAAVPVRQAAEHYGLKVSRNGMACCPFHNDRHPSLKLNEEYFFCFGCGAKGDVIDFAAQMFHLSSYEAAQRLAADFGISTQPGQAVVAPHKPKRPHIRQFREDEMFCFRVLTDYLHLLEDWKVRYAIRQAIRELEQAGYIQRSRERDEKGRLRGADYVIFELPQPVPASVSPTLENPTLENPTQENPTLENPMQLNYPCEEFVFSSYGCDLHIDNELVANAFAVLPKQEQSILILFCVLELGDGEIGDLMGMSRSAVQRHRTKTLNELRKKLKAHLPEGG